MSKTVRFQSVGGSRRAARDDHRLSGDSGVGSFSDNEARSPTFTDEEYYELRKKLKKLEQKTAELEEAFRNKAETLTEVKLALSKRQQDLSEEQARNSALKDRNELLESQSSSMKDQIAELTKQNSRLEEDNARLDKDNERLEKDLDRATKDLDRAKRKSASPSTQPAETAADKKLPTRSKSKVRGSERAERAERSDRPDRNDKTEKDEEKERLMRRFDRSDDSDTKASTGSSTSSQRRRRQSTAAFTEPYVEPLGPGPTESRRQSAMVTAPQSPPTPANPRMYDYGPPPFVATGYAQSTYSSRDAPLLRGTVYVAQSYPSDDTSYNSRPVTIPNTTRTREHRR